MESLPHDANALDGSLVMCDLKDMSARRSVTLPVEALWLSGRDGSAAGVPPAERHAFRRKGKANIRDNAMGLIVAVL